VTSRSYWGLTPRESIEAECARRGREAVIDGCARLITGGEADAALIVALGGPAARGLLDAGLPERQHYWLRVWGARGLLWVWDDSALGVLQSALKDEAWRVREKAVKVVARHHLGDALASVAPLQGDPVPRVREAARRAITILTATGA
jgi:HEAT repeat protein